ncbi:hypothetical protein JW890_08795 [candidate division WOR-3 bacterium]|nr:hypothetical protein [candidate division WOR-3 bacterium]
MMQVFNPFLFIFCFSIRSLPASVISEGDSIYKINGIQKAIEYFSGLAVATDDVLFNDIKRRISYLTELKNMGEWGDSIAKIDWSSQVSEELFDGMLSHNPPVNVASVIYAKKAYYLFREGEISLSTDCYLNSGGPENMLKAAIILYDRDPEAAKNIFLEIVRKYSYTFEADISRVYMEDMY